METILGIPNGALLILIIGSGIFGFMLNTVRRPQPPIIYITTDSEPEPRSGGCLTVLVFFGLIAAVFFFLQTQP